MVEVISSRWGTVAAGAAAGSPPIGYPVSLAACRLQLRVDDDRFDDLLDIFLPAAIEWIEGLTHRTLLQRQHRWVLRDFPRDGCPILLPRGETASVQSIVYTLNGEAVTMTGPSSTVPGTEYREDLEAEDGGSIQYAYGESWPSVDSDAVAPVVINFTGGPSDLPEDLKRAILFAVTDQIVIPGTTDFGSGKHADVIAGIVSHYILNR